MSHRLYRDSDSVRRQFQCGAHPHGHSRYLNETRQILHKNEVLHRVGFDWEKPFAWTPIQEKKNIQLHRKRPFL